MQTPSQSVCSEENLNAACRCEYILKWHFLACLEAWEIHFVALLVDRMKEEVVSPLNGVVLERRPCFGKEARRAVVGKVTTIAAAAVVSHHLHETLMCNLIWV